MSDPFVCGAVRNVQGRAPLGWVRVAFAGQKDETRWYCRAQCAAEALHPVGEATPAAALALLTQLARRHVTLHTLTPKRLARLLELATLQLAEFCSEQARSDAEGHRHEPPALEELLEVS